MSNIILEVPDISCAHCEKTVVGALSGQAGIHAVQVDIPGKIVYLDYDEAQITLQQVGTILDEEGYPVAGTREGGAPVPKRNVIPLTGK